MQPLIPTVTLLRPAAKSEHDALRRKFRRRPAGFVGFGRSQRSGNVKSGKKGAKESHGLSTSGGVQAEVFVVEQVSRAVAAPVSASRSFVTEISSPVREHDVTNFGRCFAVKRHPIKNPDDLEDPAYRELRILMALKIYLRNTRRCSNMVTLVEYHKVKSPVLLAEDEVAEQMHGDPQEQWMCFVLEYADMDFQRCARQPWLFSGSAVISSSSSSSSSAAAAAAAPASQPSELYDESSTDSTDSVVRSIGGRLPVPAKVLRTVVFQVIYSLYVAQQALHFMHHDLHVKNLLISRMRSADDDGTTFAFVDPSSTAETADAAAQDVWFTDYVNAHITDFGHARICIPNSGEVVYNHKDVLSEAFRPEKDFEKLSTELRSYRGDFGNDRDQEILYGNLLSAMRSPHFEYGPRQVNPRKLLRHPFFDPLRKPSQVLLDKFAAECAAELPGGRGSVSNSAPQTPPQVGDRSQVGAQLEPPSLADERGFDPLAVAVRKFSKADGGRPALDLSVADGEIRRGEAMVGRVLDCLVAASGEREDQRLPVKEAIAAWQALVLSDNGWQEPARSRTKVAPPKFIDQSFEKELSSVEKARRTRRRKAQALTQASSRREKRLEKEAAAADSSVDLRTAVTPNSASCSPSQIFAGFSFAVTASFDAGLSTASWRSCSSVDSDEYRILKLIERHGGELCHSPSAIRAASIKKERIRAKTVDSLNHNCIGEMPTTVCIASQPERTAIYMQSLISGFSCLHTSWVLRCVEIGSLECPQPFALPAGFSCITSSYVYPQIGARRICFEDERIELIPSTNALSRALSDSGWKDVVSSAGGRVTDRLPQLVGAHSKRDVPNIDVLCYVGGADSAADSSISAALQFGIPTASFEWIMQSIINGEAAPFEAIIDDGDGNNSYPQQLRWLWQGNVHSSLLVDGTLAPRHLAEAPVSGGNYLTALDRVRQPAMQTTTHVVPASGSFSADVELAVPYSISTDIGLAVQPITNQGIPRPASALDGDNALLESKRPRFNDGLRDDS